MEGETFSLIKLLQDYFPKLTFPDKFSYIEKKSFDCKVKVLFIFDGLDECRLALDFQKNKRCSDATKPTSVENLLTNLILGNLLPDASLWITSRPGAANQIPPERIDRVTEVRGFKDPQKEEYFVKRFSDQNLAGRIISHIKSSKSLYILCHIPVLCWISAVVLETVFGGTATKVIPKTLTEMYTHFLLIQTNMKNKKYQGNNETNSKNISAPDVEIILKLGQLAFLQLEEGKLTFNEEDLRGSGIDVSEATVYSGVCTVIFKEKCRLYQEKVYCFVHLSIQEYLAALFVFHSFVNGNINLLCREDQDEDEDDADTSEEEQYPDEYRRMPLSDLHRSAVDKALQSENGHLDLFLRFLLGLSLESTQDFLQNLLAQAGSSSQVQDTQTKSGSRSHDTNHLTDKGQKISTAMSIQNTVKYIKDRINSISSAEKTINLFHCLNELNDNSLIKEIQTSLRSGTFSSLKLNPGQCSALAFLLLMSEKVLDVFDLKMYNTSVENRLRLLTIIKNCRGAILSACNLTEKSCEIVASALQSDSSPLVELDLSNNDLGDSGVELLCHGLRSPNCQLETLRLSGCQVTKRGCASLASALRSKPSHLRELDLSYNHPGESGARALSAGLEDPGWRLEKLNVDHGGEIRLIPGLTKYACGLTLDPNTAHSGLSLSERNRKVERPWEEMGYFGRILKWFRYPPDRFDSHYQVLCREGLSDARFYWEVCWDKRPRSLIERYSNRLWDGLDSVAIGVAYRGIPRKGEGSDSLLGGNDKSWSVIFGDDRHTVWHNGRSTSERENSRVEVNQKRILEFLFGECIGSFQLQSSLQPTTSNIGVYLDWPAGTLSFYKITTGSVTHLHTFHTTFTEPVYPAFGLLNPFCTVRLHMPD
ncbi:hypothetical protein SKAU_G00117250 [Synaphobranchus kaupii]|uniref:B30.2/SPRY domain-containing protein n=1 Tax=Synaphobranchus kaupii TaxID=118154 RepID=A0A9Q1FN57_SYNKA|nr:hypothetical protein SKAU_G00117250 [Synaphobranchus kaupii]